MPANLRLVNMLWNRLHQICDDVFSPQVCVTNLTTGDTSPGLQTGGSDQPPRPTRQGGGEPLTLSLHPFVSVG